MNKKLISAAALATLLALPVASFAAFDPGPYPSTTVGWSINTFLGKIFDILWPIVFAAIIILFVVAGFLFLTAKGDVEQIEKARQAAIWGAIGTAVIVIGFSIVNLVKTLLAL